MNAEIWINTKVPIDLHILSLNEEDWGAPKF